MWKKICIMLLFCRVLLQGGESRILFLSFERGGTHWGLYCLCKVLDKRDAFYCKNSVIDIFDGEFKNHSDGWIYAAHCPNDLKIAENSNDILIVLVRNYRENLIRNFIEMDFIMAKLEQEKKHLWLDTDPKKTRTFPNHHYFNILRCYDQWDPKKRFLLYFEDLADYPEEILKKVMKFLGAEDKKENLMQFLEKITYHRINCMQKSFAGSDICYSGTDRLFHSKKIGLENCRKIDKEIKTSFPYYFDKYLKRYELHSLDQ